MATGTPAEELGTALRQVAAGAGRAAVGIGGRWQRASGVVIADGRVLTNAHNAPAGSVEVLFDSGREAAGEVVAADLDAELSVIAVDTGDVEPVVPGDDEVEVGTAVVAVANPGGRGLHVTPGYVSAVGRRFRGPRNRRVSGAIEHTAPLPRGASGGPVFDLAGRWIGINTHRLDGGLYLALPADQRVRDSIDDLGRGEVPTRLRLGIAVAPPEVARRLRAAVGLDDRDGVLVRDVQQGGLADRAGILRGDLLVSVADTEVASVDDLQARLAAHETGPLVVGLVRGVEEHQVTVDVDHDPESDQDPVAG